MDYPHFRRRFYIEVPEIQRMTEEEVNAARKTEGVKVSQRSEKFCPHGPGLGVLPSRHQLGGQSLVKGGHVCDRHQGLQHNTAR